MLKTKKLIEVLAAKELQIEVEQQEMKQDMNNDRNYVHKVSCRRDDFAFDILHFFARSWG